jgi:hypothetical protein
MTLRKLDQTKPPPGWELYALTGHYKLRHTCGRNERTNTQSLEEAHEWAAEDARPYIDDALARLVEWLRETQPTTTPDLLADAIESGEWRND